jgi:hypothetical protein
MIPGIKASRKRKLKYKDGIHMIGHLLSAKAETPWRASSTQRALNDFEENHPCRNMHQENILNHLKQYSRSFVLITTPQICFQKPAVQQPAG